MYTDVHTYIFQHLRIQYNSRSLNYFFTSFVCVSPEIDNIFPKRSNLFIFGHESRLRTATPQVTRSAFRSTTSRCDPDNFREPTFVPGDRPVMGWARARETC